MRRVQVHQRGAERGQGSAGSEALHHPGEDQDRDVTSGDECHQGYGFKRDRGGEDRPPADMIGKGSQYQQRHDQRQHVYGEDERERRAGKAPLLLVDDIQR